MANKKKPKETRKNLKQSAANGLLLSTIGLVVMNAEDHRIINIKGNNLIIRKENIYFWYFSFHSE